MTAKVMIDDHVYLSPVFAVSLKSNAYKAVVFDNTFSQLITVDIFTDNKYTVLFMNLDASDFAINEEKFKSYWNEKDIFKLVKKKKYTSQMLREAKEILAKMEVQDFVQMKTLADLEALRQNTGCLHDAYVLGMTEKNGAMEILLDTSWGSLVILRCKGLLHNALQVGNLFWHCDMDFDENGAVVLTFALASSWPIEEQVVKAESIAFKPLFERRMKLKKLSYSFSVGNLIMKDKTNGKAVEITKGKQIVLDFAERSICGYIEPGEELQRCFMFTEDVVYSFYEFSGNRKKQKEAAELIKAFQEACTQNGFNFDLFPFCEEEEIPRPDFGELLFSQDYSWFCMLRYMMKYLSISFLAWNLYCLILKLLMPNMPWAGFLFMGPGIFLAATPFMAIASIAGYIRDKKSGMRYFLKIYEKGMIYQGFGRGVMDTYNGITKVAYKNKQVTFMHMNKKIKLPKSKNDQKIYDLLRQKIET